MRFAAGVLVGMLIGRPVLSLVNEHLTPPLRRKIINALNDTTRWANSKIEREGDI